MSFCLDKVTTGTCNFASVIWNPYPLDGLFAANISATAQFLDQVKFDSISQLINGIFKV